MTDMKQALAMRGVAPQRIHIEIFNGSEPLTPGVIGAVTRAPHVPKDDAGTGPLVSFTRSGIAALARGDSARHPLRQRRR